MAQLPHYPNGEDTPDGEPHSRPASRTWKTYAFVAVGVALVTLMVILHLTGVVGPGTN